MKYTAEIVLELNNITNADDATAKLAPIIAHIQKQNDVSICYTDLNEVYTISSNAAQDTPLLSTELSDGGKSIWEAVKHYPEPSTLDDLERWLDYAWEHVDEVDLKDGESVTRLFKKYRATHK